MSVISHVYLFLSLIAMEIQTAATASLPLLPPSSPICIYFDITSVKKQVETSELSSTNRVGNPQLLLLDRTKEIRSINCAMSCLYSVIPHIVWIFFFIC